MWKRKSKWKAKGNQRKRTGGINWKAKGKVTARVKGMTK